jgi:hypothetical protein
MRQSRLNAYRTPGSHPQIIYHHPFISYFTLFYTPKVDYRIAATHLAGRRIQESI